MIIIARENDPIRYLLWEFRIIQALSAFGALVKSSDMPYFIFGYLPASNSFIDSIQIKMKKSDKLLLQLLTENSRVGYSEMARKLKVSESTLRYKVFGLVKKGIIKRFTIAVQKPPQPYILCLFEQWYSFSKDFEQQATLERKYMLNIDENIPVLTTFQMAAPLCGSYGNFIIGLFDSQKEAIDNVVQKHHNFYRKEKYEEIHAQLIRSIKGLLPIRNLDIKTNYNVVKWE